MRVSLNILLLLMLTSTAKLSVGQAFPSLTAQTLSGNNITLPDYIKGKKAMLVVAFERGAQSQADSWYQAFADSFEKKGYTFYELPMISSFWKWMSGWIDSGMRSGVPSYKHDNVATYYGPLDSYYKAFNVKDKSLVYVFLVNEEGLITATTTGFAKPDKVARLLAKGN